MPTRCLSRPQVAQLHALLPGLEGKLQRMRPAELVRLAARLEEVRTGGRAAAACTRLAACGPLLTWHLATFPCSSPTHHPWCVPSLQICQQLVALRRLLPTADVAAAVAAHPPLLRTPLAEVEGALGALRQAFPDATQVQAVDLQVLCAGSLHVCFQGVGRVRCSERSGQR